MGKKKEPSHEPSEGYVNNSAESNNRIVSHREAANRHVPNTLDPELKALALMSGFSEHRIFEWKMRRLDEFQEAAVIGEMYGLWQALAEIVRPEAVPDWLESPSDQLEGLTPVEVLRRGESDRIRSLIYYLASGMPN